MQAIVFMLVFTKIVEIKPIVSVIITTKNEEKVIKRLIQSVKSQTFKKMEIILIDNYSTDNTLEITKKQGIKSYLFGPERSAQRNFGVKMAKGNYLLVLDADMELDRKSTRLNSSH